ncbi:MAG TPA: hypothetical protein VLA29_02660 [Acidimicrobiia bacterium]|nr:hypothetical protein [Acidimicrobiia bacterium]
MTDSNIVAEWDALHHTGETLGDAEVVLIDGALRTVDAAPTIRSVDGTVPVARDGAGWAVRRSTVQDDTGNEVEAVDYHAMRVVDRP